MAPASAHGSDFDRRLIAEAIRTADEAGHPLPGTDNAELAAIAAGGDLEQRILNRAERLAIPAHLPEALGRLRRAGRIGLLLLMLAGALAGAGAARSALTPDGEQLVNFYWALLVLLGFNTVAMMLWALMLILRGRLPPLTPLLSPLKALIAALAPAPADDFGHRAQATWLGIATRGAMGRWGISTVVHAVWLATMGGALATMIVLLSARQFDFVWETTILPDQTFVALTDALRPLPGMIGLDAPNRETVLASRRDVTRPPAAARKQWSHLLIGSVVVAGILPRAALLATVWLLLGRARSRYRLDLELPGYARLQHRLMPVSKRIGIVDADPGRPLLESRDGSAGALRLVQQMAVLGLELEAPSTGWPPVGVPCARDLGIVADRESFAAALRAVTDLQRAPLALLIVCSLATSPDRGIARRLRELRSVHHGPLAVLLTQQQRLQSRMSVAASDERLSDWRQIIVTAGIDPGHIVVLDLDDAEAMRQFQLTQQAESSS